MSENRKTDPEELRPIPGIPRARLPLPPRPPQDEQALRIAQLEQERAQAEAEAAMAKAELEAVRKAEQDLAQPKSKHAFSLQVREWEGPIKFVTLVLALAGMVIGVFNLKDKAPEKTVTVVDEKAEKAKKAIEGDKGAGASRTAQGLSNRVADIEMLRAQDELERCARQRWDAEVFKHLTPPVFVAIDENCDDPKAPPVVVKEGPALGGRGKRQVVVITPMP